jgi:alkylation response protein AidB-like acyl-CoA dehydrogenase
MRRTIYDEDHELFRRSFRTFVEREILPNAEEWERTGLTGREMYRAAGKAGFLGMSVPERYGGGGVEDFRYAAVITEELAGAGVYAVANSMEIHNSICMPYLMSLATEEQKAHWLPDLCSGEVMMSIAMTEPTGGSDLAAMRSTARRDGDVYVLNGSKTFISGGFNSGLFIVACKTDPGAGHRGVSLLVVRDDMPGFSRGRKLEKIGFRSQDTAELFFDNVRVPADNLLGTEGGGFRQLVTNLPQERLLIAMAGVAMADHAFDLTLAYPTQREAFGQPIASFQNSRFKLAEMRTEIDIGQSYVDQQVLATNAGDLTAEDAAKSKWWCTDMLWRVLDTCLQLHGGYGYMEEYPIARAWRDARLPRIVGGTNEIMKDLIGRSLGA